MLPETISTEEARNLARFYLQEYYRTKGFMETDEILESFGLKQGDNRNNQWFDGETCFVQIIDKEKWFLAKIKHGLWILSFPKIFLT